MQKRILIFGKNGMLGHMVEHVFRQNLDVRVRAMGRERCDAERLEFREAKPFIADADYIINCIGVTARHIDDADPASVARAVAVDAAFPNALAASAAEHGVRVIHMSTDGVFSGHRTELYTEDDPPDATDTYGRTKILGESRSLNVLNIRCSIVGPSPHKREGLWEWVAAQPDGATIQGYTNQVWHGVTTSQFAEFCARIIAEDRFDALRADGHVLHFAPNTPCTKYELLCGIRDALGKRLTIEPTTHVQCISRTLTTSSNALMGMFGPPQPIATAIRTLAAPVRMP
ncbi:MAG: sugar nucleotide-binding protein [bacterium]|nr:sugar nucleotide-binding protein [bacterium]